MDGLNHNCLHLVSPFYCFISVPSDVHPQAFALFWRLREHREADNIIWSFLLFVFPKEGWQAWDSSMGPEEAWAEGFAEEGPWKAKQVAIMPVGFEQ